MTKDKNESLLFSRLSNDIPNDIKMYPTTEFSSKGKLYDSEEMYIRKASLKRRIEFITGRSCARNALKSLGVHPCPIPVTKNRAPVWPAGYVGSISHCEGLCIAAVAEKKKYLSIGIDVEANKEFPAETRNLILTNREKKQCTGQPSTKNLELIIFSAKESIFKCLYPLVQHYFDFLDIDLSINETNKEFTAKIPPHISEKIHTKLITGFYSFNSSHIFTAVLLKDPSSDQQKSTIY